MKATKPSWNPGRFLQTLTYFEVIPVLNWFQQLFQSSTAPQPTMTTTASANTVLVVGATGGVGKRVVKQLHDRGYSVRALVRDLERGKAMLGDDVDIIDADITLPETLTPAVVKDIRAVICCTGPRVQPKEGDTPDRAKYYQGLKFYMPEVVGDSPESTDYQGIKNLLHAIADPLKAAQTNEKILFDFTDHSSPDPSPPTPQPPLPALWGALDDVVMGGVSDSTMRQIDHAALFTGNVSTANSGGFASVRTRNLEPALNLSGYEGVKLRVKGDGQRYKFLMRSDDKWDSIAYSHSFDTTANAWIDVHIPFNTLIPAFRAKTLTDAAPLNANRICSLQLMLSKFEYDGNLNPLFTPGTFALEVQSISAYGRPTMPQFVLVSSAGVTRIDRPGINLDEEPPAVRMNDQLGGILTWKRRGEEAVRESGLPYTIVRPCALTEADGGKQLTLDQGDNLRGAISRDDVAAICIHAIEQPQACNLTFEVRAEDTDLAVHWTTLFDQLQPDR
ncbi:CIA30 family protein [Stenomitos frigidus]|uniref:NADH:ubiquinone oxidoreductase n=1 Tax=Stenomitos frigidus ULC18 TaxID=2107698 RepID=A0A2T1DTR2_9CYAN|nr:CIA30 family protein [Stenomitos frigidus]PSB23887.1 NADH:ubiquinone oxidoreductase [Stenomitos frigidus ULC18]